MNAQQSLRELVEFVAVAFDVMPCDLAEAAGRLDEELPAGERPLGDKLSRCAWCCGAEICDEIADGEINLVPDGGDDGQRRIKNGAGHGFFVERPEILQAAAAA